MIFPLVSLYEQQFDRQGCRINVNVLKDFRMKPDYAVNEKVKVGGYGMHDDIFQVDFDVSALISRTLTNVPSYFKHYVYHVYDYDELIPYGKSKCRYVIKIEGATRDMDTTKFTGRLMPVLFQFVNNYYEAIVMMTGRVVFVYVEKLQNRTFKYMKNMSVIHNIRFETSALSHLLNKGNDFEPNPFIRALK